ncbi:alpha/beta hydrolase [Enterococcus canis]|nr:alpha/beta hydrolase [Enterococcus canis]
MKRSILLLLLSLSLWIATPTSSANQVVTTLEVKPTVLVPGTGGDVDRFDEFIADIAQKEQIEVVKMTVHTDDTITMTGTISNQAKRPIIVVGFEDASDPALPEQSRWLALALRKAQYLFHFTHFDYIGHSNGGLVATGYLENQQAGDPQMDHLVTLGTPFNDVGFDYNDTGVTFTDLKEESPLYSLYDEEQEAISADLAMLNVAGTSEGDSDAVVPVTSVAAGRIFYGNCEEYQEMTADANHSDLVTDPQVEAAIADFLEW